MKNNKTGLKTESTAELNTGAEEGRIKETAAQKDGGNE